mgnify:CR=1 FL=1
MSVALVIFLLFLQLLCRGGCSHPPAERGDNGDVPGSMPSIDPCKELCDFIKTEREWTMENTTVQEVKMPITYDDLKASMIDSGRPYDLSLIHI